MKFFSKLAVILMVIGLVILSGCTDKEKSIGTAVANGDTAEVQNLLDQGVSPNSKTDDGKTLLMLASYLGHMDIVKLLIDNGADVNAKDQDGKTALIYATEKNNLEIAKLLLENGADPNAADNKGRTALMYAAEKGQLDFVKLLLENGADLNAVDINGKTALQIAQDNNQTAIADLLSKWGKTASTEETVTPEPETTEAPVQNTIASLNEQLESIFFDFNKSEIRADQIKALAANLGILKAHPELYIIMGAHADERGSRDYNIELSARRAAAIKKHLTKAGIAENHFVIYAYGKDHPLRKGHDEDSRSYNRRVDILMWDTKLSSDQVLKETIK
ncbi:MAG: OmpA family protein [Firmicutes bacterium]|nr:OmpA family protein [Bacillota bacterium]